MLYTRNTYRFEIEAAHFIELLDTDAPETSVAAAFDKLCMTHFGYTRAELVEPVPCAVLSGLDDWSYEEVLALGQRHGCDFRDLIEDVELDPDYGVLPTGWEFWAEMLIAKEAGLLPTTSEQRMKVKFDRDAKQFQELARRQRARPAVDPNEAERVFGRSDSRRQDAPPPRSGSREVKVEVIRRRPR
ncbi:hypothetical protein MKK50_15305 [Methylobacterium sp. J-043]|nr:hypothetical protein [Methylobacterium sp. J-043]